MVIPRRKFMRYINRKHHNCILIFIDWRNYVLSVKHFNKKLCDHVIRSWWSYNIYIREKRKHELSLLTEERELRENERKANIKSIVLNNNDSDMEEDENNENNKKQLKTNEIDIRDYFENWKKFVNIIYTNRLKAIEMLHSTREKIIKEHKKLIYIKEKQKLAFKMWYRWSIFHICKKNELPLPVFLQPLSEWERFINRYQVYIYIYNFFLFIYLINFFSLFLSHFHLL